MSVLSSRHLPQTGRVNQKLRTRRELLRGARELMQMGQLVTVATAAKHVGISTATSYRYFSDPETLMLEAVIEMDLGASGELIKELEKTFEILTNISDRVVKANQMMVDFARRNENSYRLFLAKRHEQIFSSNKGDKASPLGGHNMPMIEQALAPVRDTLSPQDFSDAVLAITAICGPEPYFVLKDLCGQSDADIDRICEKNLRILACSIKREKDNIIAALVRWCRSRATQSQTQISETRIAPV